MSIRLDRVVTRQAKEIESLKACNAALLRHWNDAMQREAVLADAICESWIIRRGKDTSRRPMNPRAVAVLKLAGWHHDERGRLVRR